MGDLAREIPDVVAAVGSDLVDDGLALVDWKLSVSKSVRIQEALGRRGARKGLHAIIKAREAT